MGTSFHDRLVATRDKKHSKNHPFFELWAQGSYFPVTYSRAKVESVTKGVTRLVPDGR